MSYDIRAKKVLAFMWTAHPDIPLWQDVPPKPQPPLAPSGCVRITENALDSVYGLVALHTGEMRHWAYDVVWWTVSPGPLPDSVGMPEEFLNASPWVSSRHVIVQPEEGQVVSGPGRSYLENATNGLFAPDEHTDDYHYRACHLVLGLAETFAEYGRRNTAKEIYDKWLGKDVVVKKKERAVRLGKGKGEAPGTKGKSGKRGKGK